MTPDDDAAAPRPARAIPLPAAPPNPQMRWTPVQGAEATGVVRRSGVDEASQARLIADAAEILGRGVDPREPRESATGLVVGNVQSGKTMSFTTVIGFARDNGFPLVIVIAGTKVSLLNQSHERLEKDLNVHAGDGLPSWKIQKNVRDADAHDEQSIRQVIQAWQDEELEADERATLILTVLKQRQRLQSLTRLLSRLDLGRVPVLVIDDEADQASLNTQVQQGGESATYTRLRELRDALPCHTYLQYTATPQAPLLINIADVLSPDFPKVLDPGADYVGGKEFFAPGSPYIRDIPPQDIAPGNDPPDSMLEAARVFFVGLAASLIRDRRRRSMLIHPSRLRADHRQVVQWVSEAKTTWITALRLPEADPDRIGLVEDFRAAYDHLATTDANLPSFVEVLAKLPRALRQTTIIEFNTNGRPRTPEINWRHAEGWILVGGQAVDRGFTVDLLTVTYMPRGVGVGNADTLQQRARFFGYKRKFLGICRIWLEGNTRAAFEAYVEHEELMRRELKRLETEPGGLKKWRRRFVLDNALQPCRRSVVSDAYFRSTRLGGWTQQRGALMVEALRNANAELLEAFTRELAFAEDTDTYRSAEDSQKHFVAREVPLDRVIDMLSEYRLEDPRDTASFTGTLVMLGQALRQAPDTTVAVYRMRPGARGARRTVSASGTLEDGFQQGPTRLAGGGYAYPGDAAFAMNDRPTIQIHHFDLARSDRGAVEARAAPLLAIQIPAELAREWLVQLQAGQVDAD
jgi:hypothetical protein